MPSLQKYTVGGRAYYRIVESKRINGKPTPVPLLYIGSSDQLVSRLLNNENRDTAAVSIHSYQHGDVAALKAMADRLKIVDIIDKLIPCSKDQQVSVGTTILLAAINRAVKPRSKRAWLEWAEQTSIAHIFGISNKELKKLTSQHFWNCMDDISLESLEAIENELTVTVVREFGIKLDLLFYDPTNFFTYIASDNDRSTLAQRGRNKQKRFDLRQFALSLLVSRDGQIPIAVRTYAGNIPDCKSFPDSLTEARKRLENLTDKLDDITIVYDKGNNSRSNQSMIDEASLHYVASFVPSQQKDLMAIPTSEYKLLEGDDSLKGISTHRLTRELWGTERTLVLFTSETFRQKQIRGFEQHLNKAIKELQEWHESLEKPNSGPRSKAAAEKRISEILGQQHLKNILEYHARRSGSKRISYSIDNDALNNLYTETFGKRLLMTSRKDWSDAEIICAYNGQCKAEQIFAQLKNPEHLAVRPQFHWTDQKIRVHTFICLLGLMLTKLLHRSLRDKHLHATSSDDLLDTLATIRLALIVETPQKGKPVCRWQLEDSQNGAMVLFKALVPNVEPLVYTS